MPSMLARESGERWRQGSNATASADRRPRAGGYRRQGVGQRRRCKAAGDRTPAAWIERIRALHAEQRFDEAARELNAFRDAYPDADKRLPPELSAWAASIKRN